MWLDAVAVRRFKVLYEVGASGPMLLSLPHMDGATFGDTYAAAELLHIGVQIDGNRCSVSFIKPGAS